MDTFVRALQNGALPLLESITMEIGWEDGAAPTPLRGFKGGACPRLHTILYMNTPNRSWYEDENGVINFDDRNTDDAWEACAEALAEMLEERNELGTCAGLKQLLMESITHLPQPFCSRILRAALPTLEELPQPSNGRYMKMLHWAEDEDVMHDLTEIEAPCLKGLQLHHLNVLQVITERPGAFGQLQSLEVSFGIPGEDTQAILIEFRRLTHVLAEGA